MKPLLFVVCCLIWGTTWIAIKLGVEAAPPMTLTAIRFLIAVILLVLIAQLRRVVWPQRSAEWLQIALPGLLMYGVSYALLYAGQQRIDSSLAAILFASFPFLVAGFSQIVHRTAPLTGRGWAGMAVGFAGVLVISLDTLQTSGDLFLGSLLLLGSSAASALGLVVHQRHACKADIVVAATLQMGAGGILATLLALLLEPILQFPVTPATIWSTLYLALFGSVVAFLCYYWLLQRIEATTVSLMAFVTPLVAILVGVVWFDEHLSFQMLIGAVLILTGVALVIFRAGK